MSLERCKSTTLALILILSLLSVAAWSQPVLAAQEAVDQLLVQIQKMRKGDLDAMVKVRVIRVLVSYGKTTYFVDKGQAKGMTYEGIKRFETELNKVLKAKKKRQRHLRVQVVMIPVARDKLIPYLVQGRGDIAAAMLTITKQRQKEVDFTYPFMSNAKELVVTGPGAPAIKTVEDLSGQRVHVRKSSSYFRSLTKLNQKLKAAGKAPVKIVPVDEYLETEDILEMVNAGIYKITVADSYLVDLWKQLYKKLKANPKVYTRDGVKIAWAFRKNSPQLKKVLNKFVKKNQKGTLLGNILFKRYFKDTHWVVNNQSKQDIKRFNQTVDYFKKYASKYGFDYLMITALAYQESKLDQSKRSHRGAVGVMQLMPRTAKSDPININDIEKIDRNVHAGVKYLHFIYNRYFKNEPMTQTDKVMFTFAAYNAGPARVINLRREAKKRGLDPNQWFRNVEVIAARRIGRETVQYVSNIFKYYLAYRQMVEIGQHQDEARKKAEKKAP